MTLTNAPTANGFHSSAEYTTFQSAFSEEGAPICGPLQVFILTKTYGHSAWKHTASTQM